jgi:integrase
MTILPPAVTPKALADQLGWSERRVRDKARELGACRILGNRMVLLPDDVQTILEATRCPSKSTVVVTSGTTAGRWDDTDSAGVRALLSRKSPSASRPRLKRKPGNVNTDGPEAVLTFANAAALYIKAGKPTKYLEKINNYWGDTLVRDIKPGMIRRAAQEIEATAGPATRNRHVIVPTQAIINFAADSGLCPPIRVRRFKVETKIKTPATVEWIEAFMKEASAHTGALALFMFATGARISEALAVTWEDLDFNERTALIKQTKIGAERLAHLPPKLVVALANLSRKRKPFPYVSPSAVLTAWNSACDRAGIDRLSFHCCRHGFATALLHRGVDVRTIAKLGGWKSARHVLTTYAHALDDRTLTDKIFDVTQPEHTTESTIEKQLISKAN